MEREGEEEVEVDVAENVDVWLAFHWFIVSVNSVVGSAKTSDRSLALGPIRQRIVKGGQRHLIQRPRVGSASRIQRTHQFPYYNNQGRLICFLAHYVTWKEPTSDELLMYYQSRSRRGGWIVCRRREHEER